METKQWPSWQLIRAIQAPFCRPWFRLWRQANKLLPSRIGAFSRCCSATNPSGSLYQLWIMMTPGKAFTPIIPFLSAAFRCGYQSRTAPKFSHLLLTREGFPCAVEKLRQPSLPGMMITYRRSFTKPELWQPIEETFSKTVVIWWRN